MNWNFTDELPLLRTRTFIGVFVSSDHEHEFLQSIAHSTTARAAAPADSEHAHYQLAEKLVAQRLATFDTLHCEVFTGKEWAGLHESHSQDVVVLAVPFAAIDEVVKEGARPWPGRRSSTRPARSTRT
jgi:hypothetical protein